MKYIRGSGCLADDLKKIVNSMVDYMKVQEYTFNDCSCTFLPNAGLIIMCNEYTKENLVSIAQVINNMLEKIVEPYPYYSIVSRNFTIVEVESTASTFTQCRPFVISNLYNGDIYAPNTRFTWTLVTHNNLLFKIPELETYSEWSRPLLAISSIIYDNVLFKLPDSYESLSYPLYLDYAPVYGSCRITPNVGLHYDIAGITCDYLKQTSDISAVINFIRWEDVINPSDTDIAGLPIYEYCIVLDCIASCIMVETPSNIHADKNVYRVKQCMHQFNIATVLNTAIAEKTNKLKPHSKKAVLEHLHKSTFDKSLTDTSHNCLSYNDKYGCLVHENHNKQDVYLFSHMGEEIEFLPYLKKDIDAFIINEVKRVTKARSTVKDHIKVIPQESTHILISLPYYISSLAKGVDPILKYKIENKCIIDVYMTFSPRRIIDISDNPLILRINKWHLADETVQTDIDTILPSLNPSIIYNNRNRNLYLLAEPVISH